MPRATSASIRQVLPRITFHIRANYLRRGPIDPKFVIATSSQQYLLTHVFPLETDVNT